MTRPAPLLRRVVSLALAVAAFASVAAAAPAASAATTESPEVTWGVRTAQNDLGTARQNFVYDVAPGSRVDDALVISNHDDAPLELDVYAADGFTTQSGQLDLLPRAEESTYLGTWVTAGMAHVTIEAGGQVEVPFSLSVPSNATPGDYLGGIVTSLPQPEGADGLAVDRRLGVRIQLRVDGALNPGLVVENLTVAYTPTLNPFGPGSATVEYTVRNSGNTRLSAMQSVALSGPFGLLRGDIEGVEPVPDLLPGETWTVTAHSDAVIPLFWMNVDATLAPAGPAGFEGATDPAMFVTTTGTLAVPWAQLVLILVVAAIVFLVVRSRRRAKGKRKQAEDARVKAAVAAALKEKDEAKEPVA